MGGSIDEMRRDIASLKLKVEKIDDDVSNLDTRLTSDLSIEATKIYQKDGDKLSEIDTGGNKVIIQGGNALQLLYDNMTFSVSTFKRHFGVLDTVYCSILNLLKIKYDEIHDGTKGDLLDFTSERLNDIEKSIAELKNTVGGFTKSINELADRVTKLENIDVRTQSSQVKPDVNWVGARTMVSIINKNTPGTKVNIRDLMDAIEWKRYVTHTKGTGHHREATPLGLKTGIVNKNPSATGAKTIVFDSNRYKEVYDIIQHYLKAKADMVCEGCVDD